MAEIDRLLQTYIERYESGGDRDPADLIEAADPADRPRLSTLIDGYLEQGAPLRAWDPGAFSGSVADRAVGVLADLWEREAEPLPQLLTSARNEKQLKRASLVDQLAETLGVGPMRDRVALHYHRLERGLLDPAGVSERVWDALAGILGTSAETLRRAGSAASGPAEQASPAAYARTATPDADPESDGFESHPGQPRLDTPPAGSDAEAERYAEVDDLFLGS